MSARATALNQVKQIEGLCKFLEHPALLDAVNNSVPAGTMLPKSVGAFSFEVSPWVGLGIVGLWAALDAYTKRVPVIDESKFPKCEGCKGAGCIVVRFKRMNKVHPDHLVALGELDDLRHLYAHNFAGQMDDYYLSRPRHALKAVDTPLSCGLRFSGGNLDVPQLRYYVEVCREILQFVE